ncbi:MAG: hypothetical protein HY998_03465 [candidate division NC10 bacterium]|nr:hypothetical protein [candidate division NC10 bacterium]
MQVSTPDQSLLAPVVRDYASTLQLDITLNFPSNHFSKPRQERGIHIHVFCLPIRPNWFGLFPRVPLIKMPFAFGYRLAEGAQLAFAPGSGLGRGKILYDPEGRAVAEILGTNVYVLFELGRQGNLAPLLLRKVLDLALQAMTEDLARLSSYNPERLGVTLDHLRRDTEAQDHRRKAEVQAEVRKKYWEECKGRFQDEALFLEREIKAVEETIEEYSLLITAEAQRLKESRKRLKFLQGTQEESEIYKKEFDCLLEIPEVREVLVQNWVVSIFTDTIFAEHGKRLYKLGSFRINVHFNGQLAIKNLTDPYGFYDHPHIWDGKPCLGNIRVGLAKLIGEFQLMAAAQVLIDFLKTINPKDWYTPIENWQEMPQ